MPLRGYLTLHPRVVPWDLNIDAQEGAFEIKIKGALEDVHGGAHIRAQKCTKLFNKKVNLRGYSMLHWAHIRFHFRKHLKMHTIVKKMMDFTPSC